MYEGVCGEDGLKDVYGEEAVYGDVLGVDPACWAGLDGEDAVCDDLCGGLERLSTYPEP